MNNIRLSVCHRGAASTISLSTIKQYGIMSATARIKDCLVVVLLCSNVFGQNKLSVPIAAEIVAVVQKHFHSQCVSIVKRTDDTNIGKPEVLHVC
jgi:hypothetical protein